MKTISAFWLAALIIFLAQPAYADTKTIISEATYTMGDGETPLNAEAMVLQKAKQLALEQAGTYVESYTKVKNYTLTIDEIQTIAGGVMQVEVLDKNRQLIGEGTRYYVKIKAAISTDKIRDLAQRIKGKNEAEEYKKLREDYARLNSEFETLKQVIAETPPGPKREAAIEQIRERERAFISVQKSESAFFQRLISGETLFVEAEKEAAEIQRQKITQKKRQEDALTRFLNDISEKGHIITIGKPQVAASEEFPGKAWIYFPVTTKPNKEFNQTIVELRKAYSGAESYSLFTCLETFLGRAAFDLVIVFRDGTTDVSWYKEYERYTSVRSPNLIEQLSDLGEFRPGVLLPLSSIKEITAVRGKFVYPKVSDPKISSTCLR